MKCVLIVDDDPVIKKMLTMVLEEEKYKIIECDTGKCAVRLSISAKPDLILLDLGLPDMNGREVVTALRQWSQAPIIVVSASSSDQDIIELLDRGADDYVIKPFNIDVLQARINVSLRKAGVQGTGTPELSNGPLRMNLVRHEVFLGDAQIMLTPKEYNLLRFFITHRGKMLTHTQILREVWGEAQSEDKQYLRVFVAQLRDKIEADPANPKFITTHLGVGYRMETLS